MTSSTSATTSSASPTSAERGAAGRAAGLEDAITRLPGVGPVTARRLAARGLKTVADLLAFLPRRYDDLRRVTAIGQLERVEPGRVVLIRGMVARVHVFPRRLLDVVLEEDGARIRARWFRPPAAMARSFVKGSRVALAGPVRVDAKGQREIVHPANVTAALAGAMGLGIRPRYPVVAGVGGRVIEKIVAAAVARHADAVPDIVPAALAARLGLPPLGDALRALHLPGPELPAAALDALVAGVSPAHRRMALEDLLIVQLGLATRRREVEAHAAAPCPVDGDELLARLQRVLPWPATGAQARAIRELVPELGRGRPMQRLLVGDVGSGKTLVAFALCLAVHQAGGQSLLMAPTEVLAEQHHRSLGPLAAALGVELALLTSSTPRADRVRTLARCRAGQVGLLVGTQALLSVRVHMPALRLAVVDEQHRFGVAQRARLREAPGDRAAPLPHLLVMTATPIPRTLALTAYGDLDATVLDQLPSGRTPAAATVYYGPEERRRADELVRAALRRGEQVFVACPAIGEEGAEPPARGVERATAIARHAELARALVPARVGLLHGALPARDKEAALRAFAAGALGVLVATTIVELGIDVPNATVMLVEDAERFGLAQLHQLRGRVGRGRLAGQCLLCTNAVSREDDGVAARRLRALAETTDGFRIAEEDLRLRGPGDLFGLEQAGMPRFRFADMSLYVSLLETARGEAERILTTDPALLRPEHGPLRAAVDARWAAGAPIAEEAG